MQTKIGWVGKAIVQCLLFPPMLKNTLPMGGNKNSHGEENQNPATFLIVPVLHENPTSHARAGGAAEPSVAPAPASEQESPVMKYERISFC